MLYNMVTKKLQWSITFRSFARGNDLLHWLHFICTCLMLAPSVICTDVSNLETYLYVQSRKYWINSKSVLNWGTQNTIDIDELLLSNWLMLFIYLLMTCLVYYIQSKCPTTLHTWSFSWPSCNGHIKHSMSLENPIIKRIPLDMRYIIEVAIVTVYFMC